MNSMPYHLAQFNIAKMVADLDSDTMREFRQALDPINALADDAPGYVWRLKGEGQDSSSNVRPYGEDVLINLSVWQDLHSLKTYTYQGAHADYLRRRKEWFVHIKERFLVLWWVAEGHRPSIEESMERLEHLQKHGPSEYAFTIAKVFEKPLTPTPLPRVEGVNL